MKGTRGRRMADRADMKDKDRAPDRAERKPAGGEAKGAEQEKAKAEVRKIIYTGNAELLVDDFDKATSDLLDLLAEQDGYIASSELTGEPGQPRSGRWTLRIPAEKFKAFLVAAGKLGE